MPAGARLVAAFLQQQVIAVRGAGVQDPVRPVLAGCHQLLAERNSGLLQPLARGRDVPDAELPGQHVIRSVAAESGLSLDAELDRAVAQREEMWVLGPLVGDVEAQADVEVTFGLKVAHKQNGDDPVEQCRHGGTSYRSASRAERGIRTVVTRLAR